MANCFDSFAATFQNNANATHHLQSIDFLNLCRNSLNRHHSKVFKTNIPLSFWCARCAALVAAVAYGAIHTQARIHCTIDHRYDTEYTGTTAMETAMAMATAQSHHPKHL